MHHWVWMCQDCKHFRTLLWPMDSCKWKQSHVTSKLSIYALIFFKGIYIMYFQVAPTLHDRMSQVVETFRCDREINTVVNIIPGKIFDEIQRHDEIIKWKYVPRYWSLCEGNQPMSDGLPSKASDAKLWCFIWCAPEQTVEQTIEIPVIWDAMALIVTAKKQAINSRRHWPNWSGTIVCVVVVCGWVYGVRGWG